MGGEKGCLISPVQPTFFEENGEGKTTEGNNGKWTIDLSEVTTGDCKKLDGICFVRSAGDFKWTEHNRAVRDAFESAVRLENKPLAEAVKTFQDDIHAKEVSNKQLDTIIERLLKHQQRYKS